MTTTTRKLAQARRLELIKAIFLGRAETELELDDLEFEREIDGIEYVAESFEELDFSSAGSIS